MDNLAGHEARGCATLCNSPQTQSVNAGVEQHADASTSEKAKLDVQRSLQAKFMDFLRENCEVSTEEAIHQGFLVKLADLTSKCFVKGEVLDPRLAGEAIKRVFGDKVTKSNNKKYNIMVLIVSNSS
jgi:hypothetical protein